MSNQKSADYDNQILIFLVERCEENEDYTISLSALYYSYIHWYPGFSVRSKLHGNGHAMSVSTFKTRMEDAGFEVYPDTPERTCYLGASAVTARTSRQLWVSGLRVMSEVAHPNVERQDRIDVYWEPEKISEPESEPEVETASVASPTGSYSHIQINDTYYDRTLIATFRPIRGFEHSRTGKQMTHIVTFNNSELRPVYLTDDEAYVVRQQLNQG